MFTSTAEAVSTTASDTADFAPVAPMRRPTPLAPARGPARPTVKEGVLSLSVGVTLADAQRAMILATLEHFHGDKRQTAKTLGVSLKTLYNRLDLYQSTAAAAMAA